METRESSSLHRNRQMGGRAESQSKQESGPTTQRHELSEGRQRGSQEQSGGQEFTFHSAACLRLGAECRAATTVTIIFVVE